MIYLRALSEELNKSFIPPLWPVKITAKPLFIIHYERRTSKYGWI